MAKRLQNYAEFWPFYLGEHRQPGTRAVHLLGTGSALILLASAALNRDWVFIPPAIVLGYGCAWIGHLLIERNRPATFTYPLWSLYSDVRMFALFVCGRLERELKRHKID
jgi:hypothetical protein